MEQCRQLQLFFLILSESSGLSPNHSYDLEKVYEGNYAYIMQITPAKLIMKERCDVTIPREEFSIVHASKALKKNSAYAKEMGRM